MSFGTERTRSPWPIIRGIVAFSSLFLLLACENTDPKPPGAASVNGGILITNGANYKAKLRPNIKGAAVKTADKADLNICWDGIKQDLLCHSVTAAADINSVNFLQITGLSEDTVEQYLAQGKDFSTKVSLVRKYLVDTSSGSMCAKLSKFGVKPELDYSSGTNLTYMLLFATGTKTGVGAKSMMFIEPSANESNLDVAAPDGCGLVTFDADISTVTPVPAPKDGPFVVDWSGVTVNGLGNTFQPSEIDLLQLGFYQGETAATLQKRFVDLDRIATVFYEMSLSTSDGATYADLKEATSKDVGPFAGFDRTDGVWALALRCTECQLPAPTIVAILTPI
jgi:hypothetical protein